MIDIKKVAKEMTREEFLEEAKEKMMGKLNDINSCPESNDLQPLSNSECDPFVNCKECWKEAVKDIKFKDDLGESEDKKMSKNLNIIEAMKMPVGTEFEVKYVGGGCDCSDIILDSINGVKLFKWRSGNVVDASETMLLGTLFIPIQQPVSFMDAIKANQDGKTIRVEIDNRTYTYCPKSNKWHGLIACESGGGLSAYEILKGKWYIEEGEE